MAKYRSPFSVNKRQTIFLKESDPKAANDNKLNKFKSRAGSDVEVVYENKKKVTPPEEPIPISGGWYAYLYNNVTTITSSNSSEDSLDFQSTYNDTTLTGSVTNNIMEKNSKGELIVCTPKVLFKTNDFKEKIEPWYIFKTDPLTSYPPTTILIIDGLAVDSDDNIYITGIESDNSLNYIDSGYHAFYRTPKYGTRFVAKFNFEDNKNNVIASFAWKKELSNTTHYEAGAIHINSDGVYISTTLQEFDGRSLGNAAYLIKLNSSNGSIIKQKKISHERYYDYFKITSISSDSNGNIYAAMLTNGGIGMKSSLLKFDSDLNILFPTYTNQIWSMTTNDGCYIQNIYVNPICAVDSLDRPYIFTTSKNASGSHILARFDSNLNVSLSFFPKIGTNIGAKSNFKISNNDQLYLFFKGIEADPNDPEFNPYNPYNPNSPKIGYYLLKLGEDFDKIWIKLFEFQDYQLKHFYGSRTEGIAHSLLIGNGGPKYSTTPYDIYLAGNNNQIVKLKLGSKFKQIIKITDPSVYTKPGLKTIIPIQKNKNGYTDPFTFNQYYINNDFFLNGNLENNTNIEYIPIDVNKSDQVFDVTNATWNNTDKTITFSLAQSTNNLDVGINKIFKSTGSYPKSTSTNQQFNINENYHWLESKTTYSLTVKPSYVNAVDFVPPTDTWSVKTKTITSAAGGGGYITYYFSGTNPFNVGDIVSVTGLTISSGSSLNIVKQPIYSVGTNSFSVASGATGQANATQSGEANSTPRLYYYNSVKIEDYNFTVSNSNLTMSKKGLNADSRVKNFDLKVTDRGIK